MGPTYQPDQGALLSKVSFNGTTNFLNNLNFDGFGGNQSTVFVVSHTENSDGVLFSLTTQAGSSEQGFLITPDHIGSFGVGIRIPYANTGGDSIRGFSTNLKDSNLWTFNRNEGVFDLYDKGSLSISGAGTSAILLDQHYAVLGRNSYSGGGRYWQGDLQEILLFQRALTLPQRQIIEAYLKKKWKLP